MLHHQDGRAAAVALLSPLSAFCYSLFQGCQAWSRCLSCTALCGRTELGRGEQAQLLPGWSMESRTMHMLYLHWDSVPAKTCAFIEHVMEKVGKGFSTA